MGHRNSENLTKLNAGVLSDVRTGGAAVGGKEQDSSVLRCPSRPAVKDPPNLHTPLQTSTLIKKKKKKTLFQKYIYCRNSVLFLQKLKHEFTPIQKIILPTAMPLSTCESCNRPGRVSTRVWVTVM